MNVAAADMAVAVIVVPRRRSVSGPAGPADALVAALPDRPFIPVNARAYRATCNGTTSGAPSRAASAVSSSGCSCEARSASTRSR